jgi:hypothetical protein
LSAVANSVVGMEADKNPDYLRQLAEYVRDFRDAFELRRERFESATGDRRQAALSRGQIAAPAPL